MIPYRLLAIEDDQNIADTICRVATDMGFTTSSAIGETAIARYNSFQPQVIVLDILMPQMDGFEFLQFLNARGSKSHIIILSGSGDAYRRIANNLGMSNGLAIEANIPKPFRISEVRAVLGKIKESLHDEIDQKRHNA